MKSNIYAAFLLACMSIPAHAQSEEAMVADTMNLSLEASVFKAYRPIVKVKDGALKYNLEQIASGSTATNVYEALCKLPGISEKDGAFQLAGAGTVTVIINGKPTRMTASQLETLLRSMPVGRIRSADIMYSAPPKYNVRGAAVNLVLDRSMDNTYSGEVSGKYRLHRSSSYIGSGSIAVSNPGWSADVIYSYADESKPRINNLTSNHTIKGEIVHIRQLQDIQTDTRAHDIRAAFDWTPDEKQTLSLVYTGEMNPCSIGRIISEGTFVNSENESSSSVNMHNAAVRYQRTNGLDLGADYSFYRTGGDAGIVNRFADGAETSFAVASGQEVSRFNVFADMNHEFNSRWSISYGLKGIWAQAHDYQTYNNMNGEISPGNTDEYHTDWNVSAYMGGNVNFSKGSLSLALTGDYYSLDGDGEWTFFPQGNFSYMFNPDNILQANVSSDKTYPAYWQLNSSVSYLDGYSESHGNPGLKPMNTYRGQLIYIHKQRYIFALVFSHTDNYIAQAAYQSPDRPALLYKQLNLDFSRHYGLSTTVPFSIGSRIKTNLTLNILRMEEKCDDFFDISFNRGKWTGYINMNNNFQVCRKPGISLDIDAMYMTGAIQGMYDVGSFWSLDAGLKLSFFDRKLNLTAKVRDIFETGIPVVRQRESGQDITMDNGAYNRMLTINLSWRFGGYTVKERKAVDTSRLGH